MHRAAEQHHSRETIPSLPPSHPIPSPGCPREGRVLRALIALIGVPAVLSGWDGVLCDVPPSRGSLEFRFPRAGVQREKWQRRHLRLGSAAGLHREQPGNEWKFSRNGGFEARKFSDCSSLGPRCAFSRIPHSLLQLLWAGLAVMPLALSGWVSHLFGCTFLLDKSL